MVFDIFEQSGLCCEYYGYLRRRNREETEKLGLYFRVVVLMDFLEVSFFAVFRSFPNSLMASTNLDGLEN